ncbi:urokinase plasminogen activator surface receptor [Kryptolebias marmoratus]|uniref:Urokinase plasminogen activator surface receptor-like n=1 Tax=Kryptolebias marmoratus TaxID=37003 RepID=A0A3Q3B0M9_KRYMA|nr:urokinase plasminogen activator surface receptor [Kryptolebias marmoratus]
MFFFTLVLGICILPKVDTLRCYECTSEASGDCTETIQECSSEDYRCAALRVVHYQNGVFAEMKTKECAPAEQCMEDSVSTGTMKSMYVSKCCTEDLCNTKHISDFYVNPNGKKCFTCNGTECTATINCMGIEDHCFTLTGKTPGEFMKGCCSKHLCSANSTSQIKNMIGSEMSCCQGDYCNSEAPLS